MNERSCPDCAAAPGEPHEPGCDVERCSICKMQKLGCRCEGHNPEEAKWTGEWPGVAECRERGWYAIGPPQHYRWEPCDPDTPGAMEDLNRLAYFTATGEDSLYEDL